MPWAEGSIAAVLLLAFGVLVRAQSRQVQRTADQFRVDLQDDFRRVESQLENIRHSMDALSKVIGDHSPRLRAVEEIVRLHASELRDTNKEVHAIGVAVAKLEVKS